jgi:hypothetical protein
MTQSGMASITDLVQTCGDWPPWPTHLDLWKVTKEYKELYKTNPILDDPIDTHLTPFTIDDEIPDNYEIAKAVRKLRNSKAPAQADTSKHYYNKRRRMTQLPMGQIPEEMTWSVLVLIPKSSGGTHGIGLLVILWKVCSWIHSTSWLTTWFSKGSRHRHSIYWRQITNAIDTHTQNPLISNIFGPVQSLWHPWSNQEATTTVLQNYGVGNQILLWLTNFWNSLTIVARQQGYYGNTFRSECRTTQGDIISPTIFNIIVNAVVQAWHNKMETQGLSNKVQAIFYADNGHLYSTDADKLQWATELMVLDLFECMLGLQTNPTKTNAMVFAPHPSTTRICSPANICWLLGDHSEDTYSMRKWCLIECNTCNTQIQARNLTWHKQTKHGIDITHTNQLTTPPHLTGIGNTYEISMPEYCQPGQCPVPGCEAVMTDRYGMHHHFLFQHYYDTIIITEEDQLPRCKKCRMFCTLIALAGKHQQSAVCRDGAKRNWRKIRNLQYIQALWHTKPTYWNCHNFLILRMNTNVQW